MSQENVELARRIYSAWERGDYSEVSWAADDIDFDLRFVPPTRVQGVHAMGRAWAAALKEWRGFSTSAADFRDRGDRVVVTTTYGGEGKQSGLSIQEWRGFADFTFREGKVTRLVAGPGDPDD